MTNTLTRTLTETVRDLPADLPTDSSTDLSTDSSTGRRPNVTTRVDHLRLAVISTPRSGNTWLRSLLATAFELHQQAVHDLSDVAWDNLPDRYILQVHHYPTPALLERLRQHRIRVVGLSRHPLDVLLSILHFAEREPQTAFWLAGLGGNEDTIKRQAPLSDAFLRYATSERAKRLLGVSAAWSVVPDCVHVRYETLVADPSAELHRLALELGAFVSAQHVQESVRANTMEALRKTSVNDHFWQGRPGQWRRLLPAQQARTIATYLDEIFTALGYVCDPDDSLGIEAAARNWSAVS